jgi:hypothetical protein
MVKERVESVYTLQGSQYELVAITTHSNPDKRLGVGPAVLKVPKEMLSKGDFITLPKDFHLELDTMNTPDAKKSYPITVTSKEKSFGAELIGRIALRPYKVKQVYCETGESVEDCDAPTLVDDSQMSYSLDVGDGSNRCDWTKGDVILHVNGPNHYIIDLNTGCAAPATPIAQK